MSKLRVLDLFSGIGGFSLGLERTGGFETVAFCEIAEFPRKVLGKHWPEVPIHDDVRTLEPVGPLDVVTAGFPCQDISFAGQGAGLAGERSGLFWQVLRAVRLVGRPQLLLENVAALLGRGLGTVLGALASIGYDAEWHCVPACAVGAYHQRDRIWIVAYTRGEQHQEHRPPISGSLAAQLSKAASDSDDQWKLQSEGGVGDFWGRSGNGAWWASEPAVGRVVYGVPNGVDRNAALGNAVVPQIPELIGRAILQAEGRA